MKGQLRVTVVQLYSPLLCIDPSDSSDTLLLLYWHLNIQTNAGRHTVFQCLSILLSHSRDTNDQDSFQQALRAVLLHLLWPLFSSQWRWSVFQPFYQYSPLFVLFSSFLFLLDFPFPSLVFLPPPPVFPHPAHLLRDPALCLPAEAGWKNRQPLCFSDSHHIACMPAPLRSLAVLSLLFCQLTSTNPITTPTLCPPAPPRYICPAIHQ